MKRKFSPPVILAFPLAGPSLKVVGATDTRSRLKLFNRLPCIGDQVADDVTDEALPKMRARLLRMIIENERVRTDGPRAS